MKGRANGIRQKKAPVRLPGLIPSRWKALSSHHLPAFPRDDIMWNYTGRLEHNIYNKQHVFLKRQWELSARCFWATTPDFRNLYFAVTPDTEPVSSKIQRQASRSLQQGLWDIKSNTSHYKMVVHQQDLSAGMTILRLGSLDTHKLVI